MADFKAIGTGIWVHKNVSIGESVCIGHASCIGYGTDSNLTTSIGNNVNIGAFCMIDLGVTIHENVSIDHYCRVSIGTEIGKNSKIRYGVQLFKHVCVGKNCVIAGDLVDRTIIEDEVTFQGEIAHSHRDPTLDRDTTEESSPIIRYGSVIGVNALIIGGITIGPQAYIAAGEIVRSDVSPKTVAYKGERYPLEYWRGIIKVRG